MPLSFFCGPGTLFLQQGLQTLGIVGGDVIHAQVDEVFHVRFLVHGPDVDFETQIVRLLHPFGVFAEHLHRVVDAGNYTPKETEALRGFIEEKGLRPVLAVNTHGHVDHMLGVERVKELYGVPFALHPDDGFLIESAAVHGAMYGFRVEAVPTVERSLADGDEVAFGNTRLRVIHTPGHTPGHVCLYLPQEKILLTGDTLFRESIGRTDLPGGDYGWIMKSIIDRILPLGEEVTIYPGHGGESTLGHEMLYNPFITEVMEGDVRPE